MPKLTYTVSGQEKTVEVTDSCSIGRLPENTIPLPDETGSSRRHCQILKISGGFELADLGSTNGTKVNGQKVKRHKLKDGDEIRIGETVLMWSDGSAPAASAEDEVVLEGDVSLEEPASAKPAAPSGGTSEKCFLVFAGGAKDGERIPLEKKRITFGRHAKNTFAFPDDMGVSGYHCEVSREGGAYVLRDLGSTNGTLVDGEPVTEVALQHGNRIRVGAQRLVFVDPAISDFEKAMAAVDDLGSEWGLLRAEMDMSRVQAARRSQMVAIASVLVVIAGAGYVLIAHPELISGGAKPPAPIPGNLVPVDFSFEDGAAGWSGSGHASEASDGAAKQGRAFYVVVRDGAAGRGAVAALGDKDRIAINPNSSYTFGADVRTKGGGLGCVRAVWLDTNQRPVGETATDLVAGADWAKVSGEVARPPRDAASVRLELVNQGSDAACFDDVFFAPAATAVAPIELKGGDVLVSVTRDAQATIRRGNTVLLGGLSVVGGGLRADETDLARRTDRVGSRKGTSVSGGKVRGQSLDAQKGTWADYSMDLAVDGDRYVNLKVEKLGEDAALVATLPKDVVSEGLSVATDDGKFFRMSEARAVEKVRSVKFGDRNVFEFAATGGSPAFRFALYRAGEAWLVSFGGAPTLDVRIDTDSRAITEVVNVTEQKAREAIAARHLGEAIKLLRLLASLLPQGSPRATWASDEADRLEADARDKFERIHAGRVAAVEFQDEVALGKLQTEAKALIQDYGAHPVAAQAAEEIAAIDDAVAKRRLVLDERSASPLLAKAADFAEQQDFAVARAILQGIVTAYPDTQAAKDAKQRLGQLPAGK